MNPPNPLTQAQKDKIKQFCNLMPLTKLAKEMKIGYHRVYNYVKESDLDTKYMHKMRAKAKVIHDAEMFNLNDFHKEMRIYL